MEEGKRNSRAQDVLLQNLAAAPEQLASELPIHQGGNIQEQSVLADSDSEYDKKPSASPEQVDPSPLIPTRNSAHLLSSPQPLKFTDYWWLILVVPVIIAFFGTGGWGLKNGDIDLIIYPFDVSGNQCGHPDSAASDFDYIYFINPKNFSDYTVCVDDCNNPSTCYPNTWVTNCNFTLVTKDLEIVTNPPYKAKGLLHFCFPTDPILRQALDYEHVFTREVGRRLNGKVITQLFHDIWHIMWFAFWCFLCSLLFPIITFCSLFYCAKSFMYSILYGGIVGFFFLGILFAWNFGEFPSDTETSGYDATIWLMICVFAVAVVLVATVCCFHASITTASDFASAAVSFLVDVIDWKYSCCQSWPKRLRVGMSFVSAMLLSFLVLLGLFAWWVVSLVFLYSCRTVPSQEFYSVFGNTTWDPLCEIFFWIELFLFPYLIFFCTNWFCLFFALLAKNQWYCNSEGSVAWKCLWCNLGSVSAAAFGSFLVKPIFYFIKVYQQVVKQFSCIPGIEYGVNRLKDLFADYDDNALYEMTHSNKSFLESGKDVKESFKNHDRDLSKIAHIAWNIGILGKICFTFLFMLLGYFSICASNMYEVSSPLGPILIFFIEGVLAATLSTCVIEMTCNCVVILYMHDKGIEVRAASNSDIKNLKEFIEKYGKMRSKECCCDCPKCSNKIGEEKAHKQELELFLPKRAEAEGQECNH